MKILRSLLLLTVAGISAFGQATPKAKQTEPKFDMADFNRKFEVVQWLVEYDTVAWKTTDVLMTQPQEELARLGREWFCFQDKDQRWHAVYGKLENGKYEAVFHYLFDRDGKITRTTDKIDPESLNAHATALASAHAQAAKLLPNGGTTLNQYVKRNPDRTFTVWLLPAFLPDNTAVYGGEFVFSLDPTGTKITKDDSYLQDGFRGFKTKPPREIWLNYRELEKPTLGAIFFVWYYRTYFTSIIIDNSKSTSTVIKDGNGGFIWVHVEKEEKPEPAKTAMLSRPFATPAHSR